LNTIIIMILVLFVFHFLVIDLSLWREPLGGVTGGDDWRPFCPFFTYFFDLFWAMSFKGGC